jgi:hypothetical protein
MIEILLVIIIVIEILRFILSINDSRRVHALNKKALEVAKQRDEAWEANRKLEMDELKAMAEGCDALNQVLKDLKPEINK